ncbi:MAG: CU044_5270 family protein [Actinoplanes sp.]
MKTDHLMKTLAEARPPQLDPLGTPPCPVPLHEAITPARRARRFRATALIPAGALAAAAVAAVVVVSLDAPATTPGTTTEAAPPLTASQLLLTAAEHTGADSPAAGRYLVTRVEDASVLTVGADDATYEMMVRSSAETWLSRSGREANRVISRPLGLTPLTPADVAAWQAAGSPRTVQVRKPLPDGKLGPGSPAKITAGARQSSGWDGAAYAIGDTDVSVRDLEKLPSTPTALRTELLSYFQGGGGDLPTDRQQWLLTVGTSLITDLPVSGPVRAAAFRMIADLPGVRSLGTVADRKGRPGQGFAFTSTSPVTGGIEHRFVIDPSTGRALGQESRVATPGGTTATRDVGSLLGYTVVLDRRTTDQTPPR